MVLSFLKKKDYWTDVGGVEGFIAAVKQLGSDYRELNGIKNCYSKSDSIWGRLAQLTQLPNKDTYDARRWLCTTWQDNRRKVYTTFLSTQVDDPIQHNMDQSSTNVETENRSHEGAVSFYFLIFICL